MIALWVALGAGVAAVVVVRLWSLYRPSDAHTLGSVSEQWLAERRTDRTDSHR